MPRRTPSSASVTRSRSASTSILCLEELESRSVPSVSAVEALAVPSVTLAPLASPAGLPGLSPDQMRRAYGFDRVNFGGIVGDGTGQTIAIVTAYDHPTIVEDLQVFNRTFGLPDPPSFVKIGVQGTPGVNPHWALEAALDVQWAHAAAPGAHIVLVEARSENLTDMAAAVDYARRLPGVSVVSMSWGSPEFVAQTAYDSLFTTPPGREPGAGVSFVAASGDRGAAEGALWPAVSPNVVAVGGTQVRVYPSGDYVSEAAWTGSGGGYSRYVAAPAAQRAVSGDARRTTPDVAYNAAPASGVSVYSSVPFNGQVGWFLASGTSAAAPQWAGLLAVANQGRALAGRPPLSGTLNEIYALPADAFRDIVVGSNGYAAGPGYDLATGRGTPIVDRVVARLAGPPTSVPRAAPPVIPPVSITPPAVTPTPPPAPAPAPAPTPPPTTKTRTELSRLGSRLSDFFRRTTTNTLVKAKPQTVSLRLPSGPAPVLASGSVLTS